MADGGGTSTTTQQSGPPAFLVGPLNYGVKQAQQLYQSPAPTYFPGSTVAAPSPATQAGQQAAIARGLNGNPVANAGGGYLTDVLRGKYLGGNPALAAVDKSIADAVTPQVNAQFSLGGRYASPDHAGTLATALANAEAPYHFQDYEAERANQQAAAGLAPTYAGLDWQDIGGVASAGAAQDQSAQAELDAAKQRWDFNQNLPYAKLAQYMGLLNGGSWGGTSTGTQSVPGGSW